MYPRISIKLIKLKHERYKMYTMFGICTICLSIENTFTTNI